MKKDSPYVWCEACQTRVLAVYHRCKADRDAEARVARRQELLKQINPKDPLGPLLPDVYTVSSQAPTAGQMANINANKPKRSRNEYMRSYMKKHRAAKRGQ